MRNGMRAAAAAGLMTGSGAFAQDTFVWANPEGGDWADGQNWLGGSPPLYEDLIFFDLASSYEVIGPRRYRGQRLVVQRGDVTFRTPPDVYRTGIAFSEAEPVNPPAIVIGTTPGEQVSLTTELGLDAPTMLLAAAGDARFETDFFVYLEELVIGGAEGGADAVGEAVLRGPDSRLFVSTALTGGRGLATIGLLGAGSLRLEDGAFGFLEELRMAVDEEATGGLELTGADTRLEVLSMGYGAGSKRIVVRDGATLWFPDDMTLTLYADQDRASSMVFDGGVLEGLESLDTYAQRSSLEIAGGSIIDLPGKVRTDDLRMSGPGVRLAASDVLTDMRANLTDGAMLTLSRKPSQDTRFRSVGVVLEGDVLIDAATIHLDDGVEVATDRVIYARLVPRHTRVGEQRLLIQNGAAIDIEGILVLSSGESAVISGPETVVSQRFAKVDWPFSDEPFGEKLGLIDYGAAGVTPAYPGRDPLPPLVVEDGATLSVTYLWVSGPLHVRTNALLQSGSYISLENANLGVSANGRIEAERVLIGDEEQYHFVAASTLWGTGDIVASVSNGGMVSPGKEDGCPGILRVTGDYIQIRHFVPDSGVFSAPDEDGTGRWLDDGFLQIDIASADDYDALQVTGAATLGGSLRVLTGDSYTPRWGDVIPFVTAASVDGVFDEIIELPPAPLGLAFAIEYTDAAANLVVHNRIDLTRDLRIDSADLSALLTVWGTADDHADLTNDGVVDGADLGVLLGAWGQAANEGAN